MKKIDFENFKVIIDNVRINRFRKFLSTLIRPLFSYNLKKPHRNSLEGVRERLKTLMLHTKMNALYKVIQKFVYTFYTELTQQKQYPVSTKLCPWGVLRTGNRFPQELSDETFSMTLFDVMTQRT